MAELDAVVVCAGIAPFAALQVAPLDLLLKTFRINCLGSVAAYQAAMPACRAPAIPRLLDRAYR
jgi:hypothetical protein